MPTAHEIVNKALASARQKTVRGFENKKEANAPVDIETLLEEATKCADGLEFISLAVADDGTRVGAARADIVRNFHKIAAETKDPHSGPTTTTGTQAVPPQAGAKKLVKPGLTGGNSPAESSAPEGKMSREALAQTPPANPSKSAGAPSSLFDLIMQNKSAEATASPREMSASDSAPSRPKGQEGGAQADSALSSNEAPVKATKAALHAPTRNRLKEIFNHSTDTGPSTEAAKAAWPNAVAKGSLKVADLLSGRKQAAAAKDAKPEKETESMPPFAKKKKEKAMEDDDDTEEKVEKKGSVRAYSALWDAAIGGQLGEHVRAAAEGVAQAVG